MSKNQFRRDPVSGEWSIIMQNESGIKELISAAFSRDKAQSGPQTCPYCNGAEAETLPEIYAIRDDDSQANEPNWSVRVIPNDQPFLQIYGDLNNRGVGLFDVLDGIGAHELVIESPKHGQSLHEMPLIQLQKVLTAYRERFIDLKKDTRFRYVLLHKHHSEGPNDSKNHSYSHIIATPITPARVKSELINAREHYQNKERCIFCDIIHQEFEDVERIVTRNDKFVALAPFASRAPFSIWILPIEHETFFEWNIHSEELAVLLKEVLVKLYRVLNDPAYVMVVHSGPNMATAQHRGYWKTLERDYHWHIEITPRFRGYASFALGSGFQINVVSPEKAAEILREEKID